MVARVFSFKYASACQPRERRSKDYAPGPRGPASPGARPRRAVAARDRQHRRHRHPRRALLPRLGRPLHSGDPRPGVRGNLSLTAWRAIPVSPALGGGKRPPPWSRGIGRAPRYWPVGGCWRAHAALARLAAHPRRSDHALHRLAHREGAVPYRDLFDMNFPGTYLVHLAALRAFGAGDAGWRVFDLAWLAATSLALAAFARPWGWMAAAGSGLFFAVYHLARRGLAGGTTRFLPGGLPRARRARRSALGSRGRDARVSLGVASPWGRASTIKPHAVLLGGASAGRRARDGSALGIGDVVPLAIFLEDRRR